MVNEGEERVVASLPAQNSGDQYGETACTLDRVDGFAHIWVIRSICFPSIARSEWLLEQS